MAEGERGNDLALAVIPAAGALFFSFDDGIHGRDLWLTDGTAGGTRRVTDVTAGAGSSSPLPLAFTPQQFFFSAFSPSVGRAVWAIPLADLVPPHTGVLLH